MDQKKIGRFLKTLRNEKGLTQEQLATHFHTTSRSVSRWETGSSLPDISLLVDLADFYDVDVRELIDGERKTDMMDSEIREVADKMADYAGNEKNKLLRFIQIVGVLGVFGTLISLILQVLSYEPDLKRALAILASFGGFVIMGIITLYVTGILGRIAKHKCAICGRTSEDYPNLEFRFCSKCEGNYEFCEDHLFTHKHFKRSDMSNSTNNDKDVMGGSTPSGDKL